MIFMSFMIFLRLCVPLTSVGKYVQYRRTTLAPRQLADIVYAYFKIDMILNKIFSVWLPE